MQDNSSDYIFEAYITNTAAYDSGERDNAGTWLYFPANAEEITAAFTEIGLPISATPDMYFFDDYVSDVPGLRLALPRYAHVDDLAMLAQELSDLPDHEFNKLMAVQETPLRLTDFEQFKEYPHNFDYFILIPGMNSDEALGRYQLYESGMVEMPEVWKAGIDPEAFGRKVREQDNGYFTDKGYVLLSGDEWEREKPTVKQDKEVKPSVKDFLKQAKKECAAREVLPPKADKHGPEL